MNIYIDELALGCLEGRRQGERLTDESVDVCLATSTDRDGSDGRVHYNTLRLFVQCIQGNGDLCLGVTNAICSGHGL